MITKQIFISKRNPDSEYFRTICADSKKLANCAHFYIRNTMSALKKDPSERHEKESQALDYVLEGLRRYNERKITDFSFVVKAIGKEVEEGKLSGCRAMQIIRASFPKLFDYPTREKSFLGYEKLNAIFCFMHHPVYERMPSQVNQNAIKKAVQAWKSYFASLKSYAKDPSTFTGKPCIPKYIRGEETTAWFTNQVAKHSVVNGKDVLSFVNSKVVIKIGKTSGKHIKTEVQPRFGGYRLLVTTDKEIKEISVPENPIRIFGIDVGLDNFAAVANNVGATPFIIKGGAIKAKNQWYNKRRAELLSKLTKGLDCKKSIKTSKALDALSRKRDDFIRDFFYKAAHYICRQAKALQIQVIVLGHNEGQKNGINLGTQTNQAFVSIPFARFSYIMCNTAWKYGIAFVEREESYTSKASLIDNDVIPTYGKDNVFVFSGKRIERGLYKTKDGLVINADINGAGNILRKEYPDTFEGKNLTYLCKTTAVGYKDLYKSCNPKVVKVKLANKKKRKHKNSPARRTRAYYRCDEKHALMKTFGLTKKNWNPNKEELKPAS